jgi:F-type H+-transporting ATPase subunit gamma
VEVGGRGGRRERDVVKREQALRRQLGSLGTLEQAVNAMKSLSAHHLRAARDGLAAARAYRHGLDAVLASAGIEQDLPQVDAPAVLLIGADLGLCDGYNLRLVETAREVRTRLGARTLYTVGKRPLSMLRRAGIETARHYAAATSVAGLTRLLLTLADDVLGDYLSGVSTSVHVVSARFDGVGAFMPVVTRILPLRRSRQAARPAATPYVPPRHLARVAVREYLYSTLFEILLDALASEHGARLVATQSAGEWLDGRVRELERQVSNVRRESGTQEVLEVALGARQRRRQA